MLTVLYRLCDIPSTNPSPILQEDKPALNELCLKSFIEAFKGVDLKIIFIADFCGEETKEMVKRVCTFPYKYIPTEIGINNTMLLSYELANKQDDDILLAECDYLWLPGSGRAFVEGLNALGLVSPYDHRNFYIDKSIHSEDQKIRLVGEQHWRTTERNTMTYGILKPGFEDLYGILKNYGYLDNDVWHASRAKGYPLWTPILSLATHLADGWLAPGIDWKDVWETLM